MPTGNRNGAGGNEEYTEIERCKDLLLDLEGNFPRGDHTAWVERSPTKLMCSIETGMALMAQFVPDRGLKADDFKEINMRLPSLRKKLDDLASCGLGHAAEHEDIKFMFVELAHGRAGVSNGLDSL